MCFGHSDSDEGEQTTGRGKKRNVQLKRRRSPAEVDHAEPQDPRKLSKLDSTASTLGNNQQLASQKSSDSQEHSEPGAPLLDDTLNHSIPDEKLRPAQLTRESTCLCSTDKLLAPEISGESPLSHRTSFVEARNGLEEPCSCTFQQFASLQFSAALRFELKRSTKMSNSELAACFDLISKTSQQDYKSSSRGWDPDYKMEEMSDTEMMYLLIRQADGYVGLEMADEHLASEDHSGAILGFLSFKFEPEDEELKMMRPVQYIYEVHLDDRLRNHGLGGRMMKWAESQAHLVKISKVMLTVFTANEAARRLYEREGYVKDELSPGDRVTRRKVIKADYIIMSKEL